MPPATRMGAAHVLELSQDDWRLRLGPEHGTPEAPVRVPAGAQWNAARLNVGEAWMRHFGFEGHLVDDVAHYERAIRAPGVD